MLCVVWLNLDNSYHTHVPGITPRAILSYLTWLDWGLLVKPHLSVKDRLGVPTWNEM